MADEFYPIGIYNDLLSAEHYQKIGVALWTLAWLTDRVTEAYEAPGGEIRGRVLGGAIIQAADIAGTFGCSAQTVRNHLKLLFRSDHIWYRSTGDGFQVEVRRCRKRFHRGFSAPDRSPPSDSEHPRVEELKSSRVERSFNSSNLQGFNPSTPSINDIAEGEDNAEHTFIPNQDDNAPAGEAEELWQRVIGAADRMIPGPGMDALQACRPLRLDAQSLTVGVPRDDKCRELVYRVAVTVRMILRELGVRGLSLTLIEATHEARAGP